MEPIELNTQEHIANEIKIKKKLVQKISPIDLALSICKNLNRYKNNDQKKTKGHNIDVYV